MGEIQFILPSYSLIFKVCMRKFIQTGLNKVCMEIGDWVEVQCTRMEGILLGCCTCQLWLYEHCAAYFFDEPICLYTFL